MKRGPWVKKQRSWTTAFAIAFAGFVAGGAAVSWLSAERAEDLRGSQARLRALEHQIQEERSAEFGRTLRDVAMNPKVQAATVSFRQGFDAFIPSHLRDLYVELNPYRRSDPSMMVDSRDGSSYSQAHAKHHPFLHRLAGIHGWSDVYLVNEGGEILYSVQKGPEFARTLQESGSGGLSAVFQQSVVGAARGDLLISRESKGQGTIYAGTPVFDAAGKRAGLLVVKRPAWIPTGLVPSLLDQKDAIEAQQSNALMGLFGVMAALMALGGVYLRGRRPTGLRQIRIARPEVPSLLPATTPSVEHASGTRLVARRESLGSVSLQETGTDR